MELRDFLNYIQAMSHPRKNMKMFLLVIKTINGNRESKELKNF